jgi:hypothetical protein
MYPVWAICEDGPCAGMVFEASVDERSIILRYDDEQFPYRRRRWTPPDKARIAIYRYDKKMAPH